ncbi:MAG TPA: HIRAN domain-containing protein [Bacteroidota bacterium]|nr:HIRAN domain-containing protein [Bacteroidota bacterium]
MAGYRFYDGDTVIQGLRVGSPLRLRPQPTNPYDSKAIEILTVDGVKLGYVPMRLNSHPSALLETGHRVVAEVVHVDPDTVPWERVKFAVRVVS